MRLDLSRAEVLVHKHYNTSHLLGFGACNSCKTYASPVSSSIPEKYAKLC